MVHNVLLAFMYEYNIRRKGVLRFASRLSLPLKYFCLQPCGHYAVTTVKFNFNWKFPILVAFFEGLSYIHGKIEIFYTFRMIFISRERTSKRTKRTMSQIPI